MQRTYRARKCYFTNKHGKDILEDRKQNRLKLLTQTGDTIYESFQGAKQTEQDNRIEKRGGNIKFVGNVN